MTVIYPDRWNLNPFCSWRSVSRRTRVFISGEACLFMAETLSEYQIGVAREFADAQAIRCFKASDDESHVAPDCSQLCTVRACKHDGEGRARRPNNCTSVERRDEYINYPTVMPSRSFSWSGGETWFVMLPREKDEKRKSMLLKGLRDTHTHTPQLVSIHLLNSFSLSCSFSLLEAINMLFFAVSIRSLISYCCCYSVAADCWSPFLQRSQSLLSRFRWIFVSLWMSN